MTTTPAALAPLWTKAMVDAWLAELNDLNDMRYAIVLVSDIVYDYEAERQQLRAELAEQQKYILELERMISLEMAQALEQGKEKSDG